VKAAFTRDFCLDVKLFLNEIHGVALLAYILKQCTEILGGCVGLGNYLF